MAIETNPSDIARMTLLIKRLKEGYHLNDTDEIWLKSLVKPLPLADLDFTKGRDTGKV